MSDLADRIEEARKKHLEARDLKTLTVAYEEVKNLLLGHIPLIVEALRAQEKNQ